MDGTFPSIISKDDSLNAANNAIFAQLSDGTSALGVTGDALNVSIQNASLDVNIQNASLEVTATDLDIRDLSNATDDVLVYGWDGASNQKIKTDANGELQVDVLTLPSITLEGSYLDDSGFSVGTGSDYVLAMGALANDTTPDSVDEGDIGIPRMTLDRKLLTRIVGDTDSQRLDINSNGQALVSLENVDSGVVMPVSKDTNANTETNPIYVQEVTTGVSGSEVQDFDQAVSVAGSGGTANHDYVVTGTTFLLKSVIVAASGNAKFEIQVGPDAGLVTKAVGFITGREGDTKQVFFDPAIEVPVTGTGTVRVIKTNRQAGAGQDQDIYSTIIGNDVA